MLVDTHCHIFSEYYDSIDDVMKKICDSGINKVINNGCDDKSNKEVLDLSSKYDSMYCAIGIHPENVDEYKEADLEYVVNHINDDKVVAIGEIGLDYHYTKDNRDKQIELFERQLKLAEDVNKPVIIHSRDATLDTIECLKKYKVRGVIHSFSGSYETAKIYVGMGFKLGINGVVTFKNCNLIEVLKRLSLNDIVLETDAPYLTPVPYRGEKNDSSHIYDIAKYLCDNLNISLDKLELETNGNVAQVFDI